MGGEVSVNRKFGVKSPKTTNSVQESSEIRIFCTEFLYFACVAKIEIFYIAKSYVFVFFFVEIGVLNTNRTPSATNHLAVHAELTQFLFRLLFGQEVDAVDTLFFGRLHIHQRIIQENALICL